MFGLAGAAAIKLDADDAVTNGLHIGEGVETCLSARQLGMRPAWALGSTTAIMHFRSSGIECLTLLAENDQASAKAVRECATRWHEQGREVLINRPFAEKDHNDVVKKIGRNP